MRDLSVIRRARADVGFGENHLFRSLKYSIFAALKSI
jgi:hypothetical protein